MGRVQADQLRFVLAANSPLAGALGLGGRRILLPAHSAYPQRPELFAETDAETFGSRSSSPLVVIPFAWSPDHHKSAVGVKGSPRPPLKSFLSRRSFELLLRRMIPGATRSLSSRR